MADKLVEIIKTLSTDDSRQFKVFINRQRNRSQRKDLDLFELLLKHPEWGPEKIVPKLYTKPNKNAYHTLRKRLFRHLTDFIVLKQIDSDNTSSTQLAGLIALAAYLHVRNEDELCEHFLLKAEKLAEKNHQYDSLDKVLMMRIEYYGEHTNDDLDSLIAKRKRTERKSIEDKNTIMALSQIKEAVENSKRSGEAIALEDEVNGILSSYGLDEVVVKRPPLAHGIMRIVRNTFLAERNIARFEPYIITTYENLVKAGGFDRAYHFYRVDMLYMVAHVLYKVHDLERASTYNKELLEALDEHGAIYKTRYLGRQQLLDAAIRLYQGDLERSITILEELLANPRIIGADRYNAMLNLAVYFFNKNEFDRALGIHLQMEHSDKWFEKKMGKEWLLKWKLAELLFQYELGNYDIALNRIRGIERNFKTMLDSSTYQNARFYIDFLKKMCNDVHWIRKQENFDAIEKAMRKLPKERLSTEAKAFYAWMRSKHTGDNYYETLLDVVTPGALAD